jgi:glycosyltransferase involved in cell wall biosynthesis
MHRLTQRLAESPPYDAVVAVTLRAFHPSLLHIGPRVVLDFVDHLSASYRLRKNSSGVHAKFAYGLLAAASRRVESRCSGPPIVAAGWGEAAALSARWLPNNIDPDDAAEEQHAAPSFDLVFFGSLRYAPNVDALERLATITQLARRRYPTLTVAVAGYRPSRSVERLALANDWVLRGDVEQMSSFVRRARIAVAPLRAATGIQNKVLEAASWGTAQVVSPEAAAGLDPAFPAFVAADDEEFASTILDLLHNDQRRRDLATASRTHVRSEYVAERWAPTVAEILGVRSIG